MTVKSRRRETDSSLITIEMPPKSRGSGKKLPAKSRRLGKNLPVKSRGSGKKLPVKSRGSGKAYRVKSPPLPVGVEPKNEQWRICHRWAPRHKSVEGSNPIRRYWAVPDGYSHFWSVLIYKTIFCMHRHYLERIEQGLFCAYIGRMEHVLSVLIKGLLTSVIVKYLCVSWNVISLMICADDIEHAY